MGEKNDEESVLPLRYSLTALDHFKQLGSRGEDGCIKALLLAASAWASVEPSNERAIQKASEAVGLARELGRPTSEVTALLSLAKLHLNVEEREQAATVAEEALEVARSLNDKQTVAEAQRLVDSSKQEGGKPKAAPQQSSQLTDYQIIRSQAKVPESGGSA